MLPERMVTTVRTPRQEWRTAIHEAGHAVIGRVLGLECGKVTIVPDFREMTSGVATADGQWKTCEAWEKRGKYRDIASVYRGRIIMLMAGAEAEIVCTGRCGGGDTHDRREIGLTMEEVAIPNDPKRYERRLRAKTRALIRRHRRKVEHLAKTLLEHRTISGRKVDRLLRQVTSLQELQRQRRISRVRREAEREFRRLAATGQLPRISIPPLIRD
jgi:ATP-dependent Zn protease